MTGRGRRIAPTAVAAAFALAYVLISPPSLDLAAHLLRAKLFRAEGFGIWNNWWYGGHHVPGYSVLFPPLAALLTPQVVAGLSAVASAVVFQALAVRHYGDRAWPGTLWFAAATAVSLFTGRLTFAFGLLPALATALALQRRRPALAVLLAVITALASPVAALFAALAGAAYAFAGLRGGIGGRDARAVARGTLVAGGALLPVAVLAVLFPEGGSEPFALATLWPVVVVSAVALVTLPREERVLRCAVALYLAGCLFCYFVSSPVGSNAARLGALLAGPLAALVWWRRHTLWLLLALVPLLYLQWQPPVRDVTTAARDPSGASRYWAPVLAFLGRQSGPPFRVEIPFTQFHWEAYKVAPRFPIARGWERQLDIKYNHLFYDGTLDAGTYRSWLHELAVRFVAVSDAPLDYSAHQEKALIDRGLPYLRLVMHTRHWRVYAVAHPTPIVSGPATLRALGANSLSLIARRPGRVFVRVRFTPYWALTQGSGCVAPAGDFTALALNRPGRVRMTIAFALDRVRSRTPRCA